MRGCRLVFFFSNVLVYAAFRMNLDACRYQRISHESMQKG